MKQKEVEELYEQLRAAAKNLADISVKLLELDREFAPMASICTGICGMILDPVSWEDSLFPLMEPVGDSVRRNMTSLRDRANQEVN